MMRGMVKKVNPTVVSRAFLESGTPIFWHDVTINNVIRRIPEDAY